MLQPAVLGRRGRRDCAQVLREQVRHGWRGVEARKSPVLVQNFAQKSYVKAVEPFLQAAAPLASGDQTRCETGRLWTFGWAGPGARILFLDGHPGTEDRVRIRLVLLAPCGPLRPPWPSSSSLVRGRKPLTSCSVLLTAEQEAARLAHGAGERLAGGMCRAIAGGVAGVGLATATAEGGAPHDGQPLKCFCCPLLSDVTVTCEAG
jgi:hypothetical protein